MSRRAVPNRSSTSESVAAVARSSSACCALRAQPPGPGEMDKSVGVGFSFQTGPTQVPGFGSDARMRSGVPFPMRRSAHHFVTRHPAPRPSGHNGAMSG